MVGWALGAYPCEKRDHYRTPRHVYAALDAEFRFDLDPCPLSEAPLLDGLSESWAGRRVFCNPPYSDIRPWLARAREAAVAVYLVPAKTDTIWWHDHALKADEIRFIKGRLVFPPSTDRAPFPSAVLIYR
jgi:site-specific DNA-methyltransferase (adenine-specific)